MYKSEIKGPVEGRKCAECGGPIYADIRTEDYGRVDAYFFCHRNRCEFHGHDPKPLGTV